MLWYSLRLAFVYLLKIVIKTKYDRKKKKKNEGVLFHDIFIDLPAWSLLISLDYRLVASDWANVNIMISVFDVTCDAPYTLWFICFCTRGFCFFFLFGVISCSYLFILVIYFWCGPRKKFLSSFERLENFIKQGWNLQP